MIRIIDQNITKEIVVNGTKVIIKPLSPNQRRKAYLLWEDVVVTDTDNQNKLTTYTIKNIDRDDLAQLVLPGVVLIEGFKDIPLLDSLMWMEDVDFWSIVTQVVSFTGLDDEEKSNLPSSLVPNSQESPASVENPAEKDEKPASTTPIE